MKTLADEVYWRLQGLCGLFSCFALHSCASPRTRAVPVPALPGGVGGQSCYYVLCKGSCPALELTACWGEPPNVNTGWRGASLSFESMPQQSLI